MIQPNHTNNYYKQWFKPKYHYQQTMMKANRNNTYNQQTMIQPYHINNNDQQTIQWWKQIQT